MTWGGGRSGASSPSTCALTAHGRASGTGPCQERQTLCNDPVALTHNPHDWLPDSHCWCSVPSNQPH